MKTVKEFKDAGLEFVDGDIIFDGPVTQVGANSVNHNENFDGDEINEFAWRTNTGEWPSFIGAVEVEFRCGRFAQARVSGFLWGLADDDLSIIKWRPVISDESKMEGKENIGGRKPKDIPECSPVFTQEMADAGELPPVGAKCYYSLGDSINWFECKILMYVGTQGVVMECDVFEGIQFAPFHGHQRVKFKPIDTRTEEQKLVDEALEEVIGDCEAPLNPFEVVERMISLGYRKGVL